ncbi:polysaccharide lyase family 8 protein [Flagelloscypha sp. PMI_526]|nr:polysaccharide lyase family 8 protein [Flagelloscypha sp. PMI_526]
MHILALLLFCAVVLQATMAKPHWGNFHERNSKPVRSWHPQIIRHIEQRDTEADIKTLFERRKARVVGSIYDAGNITSWLSTLGADGKWPDNEVNYATQCAAQRANWPAFNHAYAGIPGVDEWVKSDKLQAAISIAMDWWFQRDFNANPQCQDNGGGALCPCDPSVTPPEWMFNTNWFSNIILIPRLVGQACLLMNETLTATQFSNCTTMTTRAYGNFFHPINGGSSTGANLLDISNIGIDGGILSGNVTQLTDAYNRIHSAISIVPSGDGIHTDGSFGQHDGLIYNGNYGQVYANALLAAEVASAGTQWAASSEKKSAFETLFSGNKWMIYRNIFSKVLHWDISTYPRFVAFSIYDDRQPPSSISMNLTEVKTLGQLWDSDVLQAYANDLSPNTTNPNAGGLTGLNIFWTSDYVVSRGENYVSTLRLFSTRTRSSECVNSGNLKGFHLADGATYTYVDGAEYEEVAQAWDWEIIPGTTSDYGGTPLVCANSNNKGLSSVVGGATNGKIGAAAMSYTNPITRSLSWNKAWFFLEDDVQYVVVNNITSTNGKPIISTLDQKNHKGDVKEFSVGNNNALWHNGVGYLVPKSNDFELTHKTEKRQGTSSRLLTALCPHIFFQATVEHKNLNASLGYAVFPGADFNTFKRKSHRDITTLIANGNATAIYDNEKSTVFFAIWKPSNVTIITRDKHPHTHYDITASNAAVGFVKVKSGELVVADPTQQASSITFSVNKKSKKIILPSGLDAGKSVSSNIYHH